MFVDEPNARHGDAEDSNERLVRWSLGVNPLATTTMANRAERDDLIEHEAAGAADDGCQREPSRNGGLGASPSVGNTIRLLREGLARAGDNRLSTSR